MFKKIVWLVIFILVIVLITPVPFRYGRIFCETPPGKPARACPKEGDIGWNRPLIIQLIFSAKNITQSNSRTVQTLIDDKTSVDSCNQSEDCNYVWFTGECHTSEYVAKIQKENDAIGLRNGEVPARQNVKCLCEKSKCVTKN